MNKPSKIIYFDGVCNLCNGFVDFMIRRTEDVYFAPLQSEVAQKKLNLDPSAKLTSIVYSKNGADYWESGAAIRAIGDIGGLWTLFLIFLIVPRPIRDFVYRWIAKNRYNWFGEKETCRLPGPNEKERFL